MSIFSSRAYNTVLGLCCPTKREDIDEFVKSVLYSGEIYEFVARCDWHLKVISKYQDLYFQIELDQKEMLAEIRNVDYVPSKKPYVVIDAVYSEVIGIESAFCSS